MGRGVRIDVEICTFGMELYLAFAALNRWVYDCKLHSLIPLNYYIMQLQKNLDLLLQVIKSLIGIV